MDKGYGILVISVTILVLCFVGTASAANWSVDGSGGADFTGIQEAINNASAGDTIIVHSGIYYENVVVDKSITLKGIGQPVVDGGGKGDAITLTADGTTLEGFNVSNCSWRGAGIKVISNNNTITGNIFVNDGLSVDDYYQNSVRDNIVNDKPLVYLEDMSDFVVEEAGQVILVNCNNITVENQDLSNTSVGVSLWKTGNSTILNNTVSNNSLGGIDLSSSSNNTIIHYNVYNNDFGIYSSADDNLIYLNNFIDNTDNVYYFYTGTNIWNSTEEITYYNGKYTNYLGNYWDDYTGSDKNNDEIGDTPYNIDGDKDYYPLMERYENYV